MGTFLSNQYATEFPEWGSDIIDPFGASDIAELHSSIANYAPTPLIELPALAAELGLGRLIVKDEAHRLGLGAFKALGATYAVYRWLRDYLKTNNRPCPQADQFYSAKNILTGSELTFTTATDGNHGRGVAWVSRLLGQKAVIYMPVGTVPARIENIRREGAEVIVVDGTYDDCVGRCADDAATHGRQIVSDTSWSGYETIPRWIQAGYLTMFREIESALRPSAQIDLVIVQGGVGALAAAAAWYFRKIWTGSRPHLVSVEPEQAACLAESIASPGGEPILSTGRQDSIMAGLNCGLPSPVAWPLIKLGFDGFMSVADETCVEAMRAYYDSREDDPRIVSGESGAAGLAALIELTQGNLSAGERSRLPLDSEATVLLLNTEGDTDPESFRKLVVGPDRG